MIKISRRELVITAAGVAVAPAGCARKSEPLRQPGELEYNLDHLLEVAPDLVGYRELSSLNVPAKILRSLTTGANKTLYVAADEHVMINREGAWSQLEVGSAPVAVAQVTDDQIVVAFEDHIEVWDLGGRRIATWPGFGDGSLLTSIAVTDDEVFAADAGLKLVHRLSHDGRRLGRFAGRDPSNGVAGLIVPSPYCDISVAPDGFVWLANPGRHTVENYAPNGQLRSSWGRAGMDIGGFCGCCNPTHLAILSDGSFVTSEKGLPRVKVYDVTGQLSSVVAPPSCFTEGTVGLDLAVDAQDRVLVLDPSSRTIRRFEALST